MYTEEQKKQFIKQTEEGKKFNGIKTTKDNYEEFDFSKVDAPKPPKTKQSATTKPKKLVKMTKQAMTKKKK